MIFRGPRGDDGFRDCFGFRRRNGVALCGRFGLGDGDGVTLRGGFRLGGSSVVALRGGFGFSGGVGVAFHRGFGFGVMLRGGVSHARGCFSGSRRLFGGTGGVDELIDAGIERIDLIGQVHA